MFLDLHMFITLDSAFMFMWYGTVEILKMGLALREPMRWGSQHE